MNGTFMAQISIVRMLILDSTVRNRRVSYVVVESFVFQRNRNYNIGIRKRVDTFMSSKLEGAFNPTSVPTIT
jgi:hypothetical protein